MQISFEIPDELAAALAPPGQDPIRAALETLGLESLSGAPADGLSTQPCWASIHALSSTASSRSIRVEKYTIQDFEQGSRH